MRLPGPKNPKNWQNLHRVAKDGLTPRPLCLCGENSLRALFQPSVPSAPKNKMQDEKNRQDMGYPTDFRCFSGSQFQSRVG